MFGEDDIVSIDVSFACRVMRSNVEMYVLCMITFIFVKIGDDKAVVFVGDWFVELDNRVVELDNSASTPLPSLLCMYRVRLIFSPTFE